MQKVNPCVQKRHLSPQRAHVWI